MGNTQTKEPPQVVLVPPLFERDHRGRSRMCKSSYDSNFCKPKLKWLFNDYMMAGGRLWLLLSPPEDERVSVSARLGSLDLQQPGRSAGGSVALRFQPAPGEPLSFVDVRAAARGTTGSSARLRCCLFDAPSGLGAFAVTELLARGKAGGGAAQAAQLGLWYSSPALTAGAIVRPGPGLLDSLWLVARNGPMTVGVQYAPEGGAPIHSLAAARGAAANAAPHLSYALAYQPRAVTQHGAGSFSAAIEVVRQRQLLVSFLHHNALQRNVHNPFERKEVLAITNYLDLGLQMAIDLTPGESGDDGGAAPPAGGAALLRLAAAWQVNKTVLLKARLGMDALVAAVAFKSWWAPSFTLAASGGWDVIRGRPTAGLAVHVENFGNLRYERAPAGFKQVGKRLVQRHVASREDVDTSEGMGVTVPLESQSDPALLGQLGSASATYL